MKQIINAHCLFFFIPKRNKFLFRWYFTNFVYSEKEVRLRSFDISINQKIIVNINKQWIILNQFEIVDRKKTSNNKKINVNLTLFKLIRIFNFYTTLDYPRWINIIIYQVIIVVNVVMIVFDGVT